MNKEIKFRAWVARKMWEVESLVFPIKPHYLRGRINVGDGRLGFPLYQPKDRKEEFEKDKKEGRNIDTESPETIEPILMQFTGLLDKNGKEIYEGDILQDDRKKLKPFVIEWLGGHRGYTQFDSTRGNIFEIIGNIYENPELLKELNDKQNP